MGGVLVSTVCHSGVGSLHDNPTKLDQYTGRIAVCIASCKISVRKHFCECTGPVQQGLSCTDPSLERHPVLTLHFPYQFIHSCCECFRPFRLLMLYTVPHCEDHSINVWNVLLSSHITHLIVDFKFYIVNSLFLLFNSISMLKNGHVQ